MSIAYVFALVTGFVSAGFVASLWALIARRDVSFGLLCSAGVLLPFDLAAVVFSTPLLLLKLGAAQIRKGRFLNLAWGAIAGALLSGFFQGVALLSLMY